MSTECWHGPGRRWSQGEDVKFSDRKTRFFGARGCLNLGSETNFVTFCYIAGYPTVGFWALGMLGILARIMPVVYMQYRVFVYGASTIGTNIQRAGGARTS